MLSIPSVISMDDRQLLVNETDGGLGFSLPTKRSQTTRDQESSFRKWGEGTL